MSRKSRERREKPWSWLRPPTILPDMPKKGEPLPEKAPTGKLRGSLVKERELPKEKAPPAKLREQPVRKPEPPKEAAPRLFRHQPFQKTGETGVPGYGVGERYRLIRWGLTEKDEICVTDYVLYQCRDFKLPDDESQKGAAGQAVIHIPAEIEGYPVTELDGVFIKYASYPDTCDIGSVELHLPVGMKRVHPNFRVVQQEGYYYESGISMCDDDDDWGGWGWTLGRVHQETLPFTICGAPGSYAEKLARKHGLEFCKEK